MNEYLELKYDESNNETFIYVNNREFKKYKFLFLDIPINNFNKINKIESIDEVESKLDKSLECNTILIYPDVEFWGHCSNITFGLFEIRLCIQF